VPFSPHLLGFVFAQATAVDDSFLFGGPAGHQCSAGHWWAMDGALRSSNRFLSRCLYRMAAGPRGQAGLDIRIPVCLLPGECRFLPWYSEGSARTEDCGL